MDCRMKKRSFSYCHRASTIGVNLWSSSDKALFAPLQLEVFANKPRIPTNLYLLTQKPPSSLDGCVGSCTRTSSRRKALCMLSIFLVRWLLGYEIFSDIQGHASSPRAFSTALEFPGDKDPDISNETSLPPTWHVHPGLVAVQMASYPKLQGTHMTLGSETLYQESRALSRCMQWCSSVKILYLRICLVIKAPLHSRNQCFLYMNISNRG